MKKTIIALILTALSASSFASTAMQLKNYIPFTISLYGSSETFDVVMYKNENGEWVIPSDEISRMKIKEFKTDSVVSKLGEFVEFNEKEGTAKLKLHSSLLTENRITMGFRDSRPAYLEKASGFSTNYSFAYNSSQQFSGTFDSKLALAEKDVTINAITNYNTTTKTKVLELNAKRYNQKDSTYIQVGTNVSDAGFTSNPARFVGVQYRKDTSLNPDFITSPKFTFEGENNLENSVAELWINNTKLYTTNLPYGKFKFDDLYSSSLPTGDLILKIKDINGNEKIISKSIINTAGNLEEGLSDFSFDAGILGDLYKRNGYLLSNKYSYGVTKNFTASTKIDLTKDIKRFGFAGLLATPVGNFRATTSLSNEGKTYGFNYFNNYKDFTFQSSITKKDDFKPISTANSTNTTEITKDFSFNYRIMPNLSVRYNYGVNENKTSNILTERKSIDMSYSATSNLSIIGGIGTQNDSKNMFVGFNYSFDKASVNTYANRKDKDNVIASTYNFYRQSNTGFAGYVRETFDRTQTTDFSLNYSDNQFDSSVNINKAKNGKSTWNTNLDGAFVITDNDIHFTKRINDSYSIVDTQLAKTNVQINSMDYKTNSDGFAVGLSNTTFRNTATLNLDENTTAVYDETTKQYSQYKGFPTRVVFEREPNPFFIKIKNVSDKTISIKDNTYYKLNSGYFMEKVKNGDYTIHTTVCDLPFTVKDTPEGYPTYELACPAPELAVSQVVEPVTVDSKILEPIPAKVAPVAVPVVKSKRIKLSELDLSCMVKTTAPKKSKAITYYCAQNKTTELFAITLTYAKKHKHKQSDLLNMICDTSVDMNKQEIYQCMQTVH